MSSVTTTTGATVIAALSTVQVAANVVTGFIQNAGTASDMLSTYVGDARKKQIAASKLDMATYLVDLEEDTAVALTERRQRRAAKIQSSPEFHAAYNQTKAELAETMEEIRSSFKPASA